MGVPQPWCLLNKNLIGDSNAFDPQGNVRQNRTIGKVPEILLSKTWGRTVAITVFLKLRGRQRNL